MNGASLPYKKKFYFFSYFDRFPVGIRSKNSTLPYMVKAKTIGRFGQRMRNISPPMELFGGEMEGF